ncbi:hypothetical protein PM082_006932 [Marasmius tenuissimus]|nr:hypothetical protein PM082_006932 [Marasmius tenuissimus]
MRPTLDLSCVYFVLSLLFISNSHAFEFNVSSPTACDNLTVTWTGGIPPFSLTFVVLNGGNRNISLSNSSFANNEGTFTTQLRLYKSDRFLVSMSDSTGPLSGGTSSILTVGESTSGGFCSGISPVGFSLSYDRTIAQCQPYSFTRVDLFTKSYVSPLTVFGFVPGGNESFVLYPPPFDSFRWNAHLKAQTSVIFSAIDSEGRIGRTGDLLTVLPTNDSSCLSSPPQSSSQSFSPILTPSQFPSWTSNRSRKGLGPGDMAGTIIGVLASVGLFTFIGWWLGICRRHPHFKRTGIDKKTRKSSLESNNIDLSQYDFSHTTRSSYPHEVTGSRPPYPETSYDPTTLATTVVRTEAQGVSDTPPRSVVHRDINEEAAHPIESPPEYSESRPPIPGFPDGSPHHQPLSRDAGI